MNRRQPLAERNLGVFKDCADADAELLSARSALQKASPTPDAWIPVGRSGGTLRRRNAGRPDHRANVLIQRTLWPPSSFVMYSEILMRLISLDLHNKPIVSCLNGFVN